MRRSLDPTKEIPRLFIVFGILLLVIGLIAGHTQMVAGAIVLLCSGAVVFLYASVELSSQSHYDRP